MFRIEKIVGAVDTLPTPPGVALEVLNLVSDENVDIKEIQAVIERDPALAGKILKVANSAIFGLPNDVNSISKATVLMGLKAIKLMALSVSIVDLASNDSDDGFDYSHYWRQTLMVAMVAGMFAGTTVPGLKEEAFVSGLLSNVGSLLLHERLGETYGRIFSEHIAGVDELEALENAAFGVDHMEVGEYLLQSWGLPSLITRAVGLRGNPESYTENDEDLAQVIRVLHVADLVGSLLARSRTDDAAKERESHIASKVEEYFAIDARVLEPVYRTIATQVAVAAEAFCVDVGGRDAIDEIGVRVAHALDALSKSSDPSV